MIEIFYKTVICPGLAECKRERVGIRFNSKISTKTSSAYSSARVQNVFIWNFVGELVLDSVLRGFNWKSRRRIPPWISMWNHQRIKKHCHWFKTLTVYSKDGIFVQAAMIRMMIYSLGIWDSIHLDCVFFSTDLVHSMLHHDSRQKWW